MSRALRTVVALVAVALAAPTTAAAQDSAEPPDLSAAAAIVVDGRDGDVMFAESPDSRRAIASTTKLMTALLTLERARPRDVVTAPPYNAQPVESRP